MKHVQRIADSFIGIFLFASLSVFIYFLTSYEPVFEWRNSIEMQLEWRNKVLIFSGLCCACFCALLFSGKEIRLRAALILTSTTITLLILNLFLGLENVSKKETAIKESGINYDRRTRLEVINDLRMEGYTPYPSAQPSEILGNYWDKSSQPPLAGFFPLGGVSNVKTVLCNESGDYSIYQSDRYGFNNDDLAYETEKPTALLLGDSFAQGDCVPPGKDIAGRLRHNGYNAITLGMSGTGPLIMLAGLKEYGPHLNVRSVFWVYYNENDLRDLADEPKVPFLRNYLNEGYSQNLITKQPDIDELWKKIISERETAYIKEKESEKIGNFANKAKNLFTLLNIRLLLGLHKGTRFNHEIEADEEIFEQFKTILQIAKNTTERLGAKLHFVFLPSYENIVQENPPNYSRVLAIAKETGLPVIDFYDYLKQHKDPLSLFPFRLGMHHYNPKGYDELANLLINKALNNDPGFSKK